jgi:PAS domain S-box-containing protein
VRVVHEKCVHFKDETGKVIRSEGMVHDITEQRQSEEALRLSEEKYRTMVETAAEGIVLAQPDGKFDYVNQQMANMLGYPVDEILGKTGADFMYQDQQPLVQQLRNELHKGDVLQGEFHFRRKDGSELWSMYNASPVFNDKGEHLANLAMHTDITERKQAEQALRKAYDELELRVQERTQELKIAVDQLRAEINERQRTQADLESSLQELQVIEEELRNNNEMLLDAQKVLNAERQRYRDLFEFAPDGYVVTDINGLILEANQFAARLLGIAHQYLIGKPVLMFIAKSDHNSFSQLLSNLSRPPAIMSIELRLQPRRGPEIISAVTVATANDQENADTLRWTIRDITERKRAEEIIRQNSLRNTVLSEVSLSLPAASLNEKAVLDIVVSTTARLVGDSCVIAMASEDGKWLEPVAWHHNKPEALALMNDLYAGTRHKSVVGSSGRVFQSSQPLLISKLNATGSGEEISHIYRKYVEQVGVTSLLIVPIQVGNNTIGTIGLTRDTGGQPYTPEDQTLVDILANRTAQTIHNARLYQELQNSLQKELEVHDQLVQSEKFAAVGRLLASITHEINNPLQTIKNCLYLSQEDTESTSPIKEYLRIATAETDRLSNLVAQLREIYRPPTQRQSKPVNLPALIDEVQILLVSYLQEKFVRWEVIPPDPDMMAQLKVEGVPDQLKQVFLNIALNAIDAMEPKGGRLIIDFKAPADNNQLGICFRDTGPGLPQEVKDKLFEPFTTTKEKGLGLGLTICYDIIQKHDGHIEVESKPGEGAVFTIWLPVKEKEH